jgi:tRNA A-37 threonylcarbamoyl transferase component Bud32
MTRTEAESIAAQPGRLVKELRNRRIRVVGNRFVKEHPRAMAEWENGHALEVRHLPTPRLWAAKKGVVIGDWHARAVPLWDAVKACFPTWTRGRRNEFLFRLARDVRRLHVRGCFHKDLKANNIIVEGDQVLFIDLDRVRIGREADERERLFNLAQLNAAVGAPLTIGERLRFYRYYAGNNRAWRTGWKARVREIMKVTVARRHWWPPK